jgi:Fur family ferric uptake transcriptional regulator
LATPVGWRALTRDDESACRCKFGLLAFGLEVSVISRDEAKRRVHEAGLRATAPRVAVLRLLAASNKPLSHSEVVAAIGSADCDQATLYRNLVKLVEADLARVANNVGGVARYEARGDDDSPHLHPHFSCRTCSQVECLPHAKLAGPVERRWYQSLAGSELQLIGECPNCMSAKAAAATSRAKKRARRRRT